jgi:NitT/TauT family transport system substrate-binding protein
MRSSRWLAVVVLACLAAVLVACGDDDDSGDSEQAAQSSGPVTCSGGTPVRFQLSFFPNAQHVGYLVAANRGYYEDEGLNVKVVPGGPTVNPPLQLAQGQVDIAQMDFADYLNARQGGAPITYVAQTYQQNPLRYVSLKDKVSLKEPADLEGKVVGEQQAGGAQAELKGMLDQAGLTIDDVEIKNIGFAIEDLLNGKSEVFPLQTFFHVAQLESAKIGYPDGVDVLDPNEYGVGVAAQGLSVNDRWAADNEDAVVCFLRASLKGWQDAIADPKAALDDVQAMIPEGASNPKDDAVNIEETLKLVTTNAQGDEVGDLLEMDTAYLQQSADTLREFDVVKQDVTVDEVIDPAPLEAARQAAGS